MGKQDRKEGGGGPTEGSPSLIPQGALEGQAPLSCPSWKQGSWACTLLHQSTSTKGSRGTSWGWKGMI